MQPASWKAAVSAIEITPKESMWLGGWAARRQPAQGKAGELFCKVLALEDGHGGRFVVVTLDLIAVTREFAAAVAAKVGAACGLSREQILFNVSHTHTGPEVRLDKVPFFEIPPEFAAKIEPYVSNLCERVADTIIATLKTLKPVKLIVRQTHAAFARNRRADGGPVDHDVPILEVLDEDGGRLVILTGYACHNLTLPPEFCDYHGDYAGLASERLEQNNRGAKAMFLAGAGGDLDPAPRGNLESTEQHADALARAIQDSLAGPGVTVIGSISSVFEEVDLKFKPLPSMEMLKADLNADDPPRKRKAEYLLKALAEKRALPAAYPCPVHVIRFGEQLLLIALGGEPVAEYAVKCKTEFSGPLIWVAGYSNDMFGYLPTKRMLAEGGYEGDRALRWSVLPAPFTDDAEAQVMSAIRRLVKRVRN